MEANQSKELAVINGSLEVFKSAPMILQTNQDRTSKALNVGNRILVQWQNAWAIENEEERLLSLAAADERSNNYLVNCGTALKEEKEARAAITQMMDEFKKLFTTAENDIDKTKPNTVPSKVQSNRDAYAQEIHKINERKRLEAERIAAKAKEAISIKTEMTTNYTNQYYNWLAGRKQALNKLFNEITLADYEAKEATIRNLTFSFANFKHEGPYAINPKLHANEELAAFANEVIQTNSNDFASNYIAEMEMLKQELIEKLPSKQAELLEQKRLADEAAAAAEAARKAEEERQAAIATANAVEKVRLEKEAAAARGIEAARQEELRKQQEASAAEQKKREDEEAARLQAEAEDAKRKAEEELEIKKQGEQTMVMFETEATLAETATAPKVKNGYSIEILHQAAFVQIFQLWFENEGKNLTIDKIGNTKLDQMKTWCEKHALKNDVKIDSKFLKYNETIKAVNSK